MADVPAFATPYMDPAHVACAVAIADGLERNAAITHGYHDLSEAVAAILGRDNANWLTFGKWASAEARASIAGQTVPWPLRHLIGHQVSESVARGNAAIFGDIAPPFIAFVSTYLDSVARQPGAVDLAVRRRALLGHPSIDRTDDMRLAFNAYADAVELLAAGNPDPRRLAERIFVGNVAVAAHEQAMADPFIHAAIPGTWLTAVVATSQMRLLLPERELALDRDVPPPEYLAGAMFPEVLCDLTDPDAAALAKRFGQDVGSASLSDAPDWEDFTERMGFIFTLFRAYQCDLALHGMPPGIPDVPWLTGCPRAGVSRSAAGRGPSGT